MVTIPGKHHISGVPTIAPSEEAIPVLIQINTDSNIDGDDQLRETVNDLVAGTLDRFGERITRVEVHLSDMNAHKGGRDTRCVIEARVAGLQPVTVDDLSETVDDAVRSAVGKLERALDNRLGRLGRR